LSVRDSDVETASRPRIEPGASEQNGIGTPSEATLEDYAFQCAPPANAMASRELRAIATRLTSFMRSPPPNAVTHPQLGDYRDYRGSPVRGTSPVIGVPQGT
jgi:hypothetical protein